MYLRALLNQLRGTVLSMQAIRRVRPEARLIQTDDLGTICGTGELRSRWELLNERQWLPYELLCGRVDAHHPMFAYMRSEGISEAEIHWFGEHACPPDIVGVNYYVTSDRYLDHRLELYPQDQRSAEGPFIDTEAVRAHPQGIAGVGCVLTEAWKRYRIPVAITEVHLGSTIDEQIRWFAESWEGAAHARSLGTQCVAVTAWALLGSFFWNELVTCENGHYEPGVFDIRSGTPEPTELADVIRQLACGGYRQHPALTRSGWWRQHDRISFPYAMEMAV
jgi:dTDP-4-dehydrorhamnose reductase